MGRSGQHQEMIVVSRRISPGHNGLFCAKVASRTSGEPHLQYQVHCACRKPAGYPHVGQVKRSDNLLLFQPLIDAKLFSDFEPP